MKQGLRYVIVMVEGVFVGILVNLVLDELCCCFVFRLVFSFCDCVH